MAQGSRSPDLEYRPMRVAVDGDKSEEGYLVLHDDVLVAVISHLQETVDGELRDSWYVEAGFGPCDGLLPAPIFKSRDEAERWVLARVQRRRL
jgi:hypothetical protein